MWAVHRILVVKFVSLLILLWGILGTHQPLQKLQSVSESYAVVYQDCITPDSSVPQSQMYLKDSYFQATIQQQPWFSQLNMEAPQENAHQDCILRGSKALSSQQQPKGASESMIFVLGMAILPYSKHLFRATFPTEGSWAAAQCDTYPGTNYFLSTANLHRLSTQPVYSLPALSIYFILYNHWVTAYSM